MDVRTAVAHAQQYVQTFSEIMPAGGMRLEETEYNDDNKEWRITLSFVDNALIGSRIYKAFFVDDRTGTVKAMKNRNFV